MCVCVCVCVSAARSAWYQSFSLVLIANAKRVINKRGATLSLSGAFFFLGGDVVEYIRVYKGR